jgi:hypothetical protein
MIEDKEKSNNLWEEEIEVIPQNKINFPVKKFLVFIFVLILIGGIFIGYVLYKPQAPQISIEFQKPEEILVGQSFDLGVVVYNNFDKPIDDVKITLFIPESFAFIESDPTLKSIQLNIGSIPAGGFHKEKFKLIAFSDSLSVKQIKTILNYKVSGAKIYFENSSSVDLNLGQSIFDVFVSAPEKVFSSQDFKMTIKYQNNSNEDIENLFLKVDYPPTFKFISSNPKTQNGSNVWSLGKIKSKAGGEIEIVGILFGQEGQNSNFAVSVFKNISNKSYNLALKNYNIVISEPNLTLNVLLNGDKNYIAQAGELLFYQFQLKNNLDTSIENIVLKAKFDSPMFDFQTAETNGYFDSLANTFIWNTASEPGLKNLAPQQSIQINLKIKLKSDFPIKNEKDKDFILKVLATASSPTVPQGIEENEIFVSSEAENKIKGKVEFESFGLYRDARWGIVNKGLYPPKVNQPTQYSIHWRIKNYANDLSNVKISSLILPGTKYTGVFKSNIDIKPQYDETTGLFSVNIPFIPANRGVINEPIEIVFQVENTPSINQVGENVVLIDKSSFEAQNEFTDETINLSSPEINTSLLNDPTIKIDDRRVRP